ncbi:M48 metallopeptidase family protein [Geomesophilobacter sediminis]|uniref:M48 family metallopeptidase n=1 Tax=Geomesophilobacter sediminis TaxID=2798584 RepID=A0A8J7IR48_9BACT|nr:M48 family metallopeptidase [Geomesophilobacter sediminis]MBJ6725284.1 M48 family metallopeptidase [Geomesophilobacter sediminis]
MKQLKYLAGYAPQVVGQVSRLIEEDRLGAALLQKYPNVHEVRTDRALYAFAVDIKNDYLRNSPPLSKVVYDQKIVIDNALGLHTFASRVQGAKLKAKHEIRVASLFKEAPLEFLRMIVVHELAHLKERDHNKAFYQLCEHLEPEYHQLEFDLRLYLTYVDLSGPLYDRDQGSGVGDRG